jgi:hypothetical protein
MENNLVHIAISANTLASLIESRRIHAVDFNCLNDDSKKNGLAIVIIRAEINAERTNSNTRITGYV